MATVLTSTLPRPNTVFLGSNATFVSGVILNTQREVVRKMESQLKEETTLMKRRIKKYAPRRSGAKRTREGSSRRRGTYAKSIESTVYKEGLFLTGEVGTDEPYGRRLEMGFIGKDSLDRFYNQAPRWHFKPGFQETQAAFLSKLTNTLTWYQGILFQATRSFGGN